MKQLLSRNASVADLICITLGFPAAMLSIIVFGLPVMFNTLVKNKAMFEYHHGELPATSRSLLSIGYPFYIFYAITVTAIVAYAFRTDNIIHKAVFPIIANLSTVFVVIWAALAVYYPYLQLLSVYRGPG